MANTKKKTNTAALEEFIVGEPVTRLNLDDVSEGSVRIDDGALINVKSNVFGKLIYVDRRTREETIWPACGTIQQMTYESLRSMKASSVDFYKNQWIVITGFADENADKYTTADIYKSLMVANYYKNLIDPSDYESVCSWDKEEIAEKVSLMSRESKTNLAVALNTYIQTGILDSLGKIKAFEKALGCSLMSVE